MITAAEYHAWAEESLECAQSAQTKARAKHTSDGRKFGWNRRYGLSALPSYRSAFLTNRYDSRTGLATTSLSRLASQSTKVRIRKPRAALVCSIAELHKLAASARKGRFWLLKAL
jgi:hypothetical protein